MKKNWKKIFGVVVILVIGILSMNFLGSSEKESNKKEFEPEIRTVETQKVIFSDMSIKIDGNGVIEPLKTLNFVSEASGVVLFAKNNLKNGTFFEEGEVVLTIDSREIENNLYSMRSDFLNTVAALLPELKVDDLTIYNKWIEYFEKLDIQSKIPALPEITNNQEKIKASTRNIFTKYYAVKNQEILLTKYTITSPFSGYISSSGVVENSFVSRGQVLFTLNDAKNLEIAVPLLVEEFSLINFESNPHVKIFPESDVNSFISGRIVRKETKFERNSQTLNVFVAFSNVDLNPFYLPGNYVNVQIDGKKMKNIAMIPRYVINDDSHIYTMEDGKLNKRLVEVVALQKNQALIKNSLPETAEIVTTILQKPLIGMEIQSASRIAVTDTSETISKTIAPTTIAAGK